MGTHANNASGLEPAAAAVVALGCDSSDLGAQAQDWFAGVDRGRNVFRFLVLF